MGLTMITKTEPAQVNLLKVFWDKNFNSNQLLFKFEDKNIRINLVTKYLCIESNKHTQESLS